MADQASARESVQPIIQPASRRSFLKTSAVVAGGAFAGTLSIARSAHAAGDDVLRIGLVGCGGRGTGAAAQALSADKNVKLVAMGDTFSDRLSSSLENLRKQSKIADKIQVTPENCFVGFDSYQQVLNSGIDVVLLCSPPHFRPTHIRAAVDAGKHIFAEKPVAVDAPGVRSVLASCEDAKKKNLSVVSGLCWRYDLAKRETMKRVLDGAVGDIVAIQVNYNTGTLWKHDRKPEWSDMEWQVRNWLYFTWLSGDHNVEQHVHSLDKAAWAMRDEPPVKCWGLGGRQVRTQPEYGNIFDHHAVVYEYASGVKLFAFTRQMAGCSADVSDYIMGTKGRAEVMKDRIVGDNAYKYEGPKPNMYQQEHDELFASIRSGQPINNGLYMARSTMLAIMGRMATYSGQTIDWASAFGSTEDLTPASYVWGPVEVPEVAMPGLMKKSRNSPLAVGKT